MAQAQLRSHGEFPLRETHRIPALPGNRMELSSEGKGWHDLYVSVANEQSWSAAIGGVDHFCLAYCVSGSASITRHISGNVASHRALLRPGYFGSIPAGADTCWRVEGTPQVMLLYLRSSLLKQVVNHVFEGDERRMQIRPILGEAEPLLEQLSLAVLSALRAPGADDRLYVDSLANALAVQTLFALGDADTRPAQAAMRRGISNIGMRRVLDYIDAELGSDLSLAALAQVANYSPSFFARAFKRHTGEPLHQYVLQRRVARARQLLLGSDEAISQIAVRTGFSSQSHLNSVFRRLTGVTPGALRLSRGL
ncbi:AraC family transcriptional regulator [Pusillimonas sp.]|uniref:helix-turn-helix transcriptional regulator n=1 Tax=Pusillimonas sp. TaxID=3040095 RepID=UPI002D7EAE8E|nr:AraC family transcriptional regulator [Pusillimonas sp.]